MNKSIVSVSLTTNDERVRELTRQLFALAGKRVRVMFRKRNGEIRTMDCVPRNQFNATLGIESTASGIKMVCTKCKKGMITVAEIVGTELRPRTINLCTVIGDIVPLAC